MGRLEPFNWRKPAGPTPEALKVSGDKHFTDALKYRLPPPPKSPNAICAANCGRPTQKAPSTSTRAPATSRPPAAPMRATTNRPTVIPTPVPVPGYRSVSEAPRTSGGAAKPAKSKPAPAAKAAPAFVVPKFISIVDGGAPKFKAKVTRDLELISGTKSGKMLLQSLEKSGKMVTIKPDGNKGNFAASADAWTSGDEPGMLRADGSAGPAANVEVGYNPDRTSLHGKKGSRYYKAKWAGPPNRPADVGLYHELVHADDLAHGILDVTKVANKAPYDKESVAKCELRAAGLAGKSQFSENIYRKERGLMLRTFY